MKSPKSSLTNVTTKLKNLPRFNVMASLSVVIAVATIGYVLFSTSAAGFFASLEPEDGTPGGNASIVTDSGASGGKALQFGTAATGGGGSTAGWPASPPAQVCGNNSVLGGGPATAPAGAVTVPAGNNSNMDLEQANKTYWFAPGVHTLGTDQYSQIAPASGSTYVGAPGAIIDGQGKNNYAFTQKGKNVTIKYLTIRNFTAPRDEGVVNHDAGDGWTIEYNTIADNKGAGLMAGPNNTYRYNCIKDNGQYAINACCGEDSEAGDIKNFVLDHNEIAGNNTDDWESKVEGCGCTGGVKFWLNKDVTVTNNWVHHNHGVGLWLDNNNRGFRLENNYINDNEGFAIMAEAGYDFQIRYNNIVRNGIVEGSAFAARKDPFPTGAIYISESGSPPVSYTHLTLPTIRLV